MGERGEHRSSSSPLFFSSASAMVMLLKPLLLGLLFTYIVVMASATTISLYNKCSHPVCPGIQPSAGQPILARGGFKLQPNKAYSLHIPADWSGRIWGHHGCSSDAHGRGRCTTGDCGGALFCNGIGSTPPATLAEITLSLGFRLIV